MIDWKDYVRTCVFDAEKRCEHDRYCDACPEQPAPEDKKNGRAVPLPLKWEPDPMGNGMGWPACPACGEMPYSTERCIFCGQRFIQDERTEAYNEPPGEERRDCIMCGGKGTMIGTRARSNGHLHGECEVCGCCVME